MSEKYFFPKSKLYKEFLLSPLDCLLINKQMMNGYKLVLENDPEIQQYLKIQKRKLKKIKKQKNPFIKREISLKDKENLANSIRFLPEEQLKGIKNVIDLKKESENKDGFYELDISKLSDENIRKLEDYVKSCKRSTKTFIPARFKKKEVELNEVKNDSDKKEKIENIAENNIDNDIENNNLNKIENNERVMG